MLFDNSSGLLAKLHSFTEVDPRASRDKDINIAKPDGFIRTCHVHILHIAFFIQFPFIILYKTNDYLQTYRSDGFNHKLQPDKKTPAGAGVDQSRISANPT